MPDLVVVGGGPAGTTAAVYAAGKRVNTLPASEDLVAGPKGLAALNLTGEIEVNRRCEPDVRGLYAAGHVTDVPEKQLVWCPRNNVSYPFLFVIPAKAGIQAMLGDRLSKQTNELLDAPH